MLYKIFLPPKEFGGKCICFVILRDLSIAYLAYVSKERGNATKYCEVYPLFIRFSKQPQDPSLPPPLQESSR